MLKRSKKIISVAVALSLIVAMETGLAGKPARAADDYGISNPVTESNGVTTWDKVKFGSYYQTAEFKTEEPIKWRVLSVNGDDAFLLADQCLDSRQYTATNKTEEYTSATWETCSLRKWLNEDFYNEAFSDSEKAAIRETVVNNQCGEVVKNDTTDRIYLLSVDEVCNADYGFESDDSFTKTRKAQNTDYAKCNNATDQWNSSSKEGGGVWWLRTGDVYGGGAYFVDERGTVEEPSSFTTRVTDNKSVRPALRLSLSSSVYTDAGEVDSEGNMTNKDDGISAPTKDSQGVTTWDCVYLGNWKKAEWKKEPIEWRVLSVNGDDAFLLADKCLDGRPYNTEYERVTWEACSLRKWLNEDFYNEAFGGSEQAAIRETAVANGDNPDGVEGGNDTTDRIYLLSANEACNEGYGFVSQPDIDKIVYTDTRKAQNTDYAKCNNAENSPEGLGSWRLRSPATACIAAFVEESGHVNCYGISAGWYSGVTFDPGRAVRPVLHLDLSADSVWSYAGTVASDEGDSETTTPSPSPAPTATVTPTKALTSAPIPTLKPTLKPTQTPIPTLKPTAEPIFTPSDSPKPSATVTPDLKPTTQPAGQPTEQPQVPFDPAPIQPPSQVTTPSGPVPTVSATVTKPEQDEDDDDAEDEEDDFEDEDEKLKKSSYFMSGNFGYKITKLKKKKGEITVVCVKSKNSKAYVIPNKVKKQGITFTVTSVQANTFQGCKKAKTLTIKATGIKTIAKKGLNGLNKRIPIKVPKKKLWVYRKMLQKCGYRVIKS